MSKLKKLIEKNTISIPFKRGERNIRAQPNWATVSREVLSKLIHLPESSLLICHTGDQTRLTSEVLSSPNKSPLL